MTVPLPEYEVRRAGPEDAAAYARTHVKTLRETYAHIMPEEFHQRYESTLDQVIERHRTRLEQESSDRCRSRSWVAIDPAGAVVGIAAAGPRRDVEWQRDAPPSPIELELHHLYTLAATHGSGLGQRMLDAAIDDRAAYLWILNDNPRAERFYRRNGFVPDGTSLLCGPSWYDKPMFRMVRA